MHSFVSGITFASLVWSRHRDNRKGLREIGASLKTGRVEQSLLKPFFMPSVYHFTSTAFWRDLLSDTKPEQLKILMPFNTTLRPRQT